MEGNVLEGRILISEIEQSEKVGSIFMLSSPQREGVVEVGGDQVGVGSRVLFRVEGTVLKIDDKEYILLNERDVLYVY